MTLGFRRSLQVGRHRPYKIAGLVNGDASAPTLSNLSTADKALLSIGRTSTGVYTITLSQTPATVVSVQLTPVNATAATAQVTSISGAVVTIKNFVSGSASDAGSIAFEILIAE